FKAQPEVTAYARTNHCPTTPITDPSPRQKPFHHARTPRPVPPAPSSSGWPATRYTPGSNQCAAIMGDSIKEIKKEINTATEGVTANSLNKRPINPPTNHMGIKTATSEKLIAVTVKLTSRRPRTAARKGLSPFSK